LAGWSFWFDGIVGLARLAGLLAPWLVGLASWLEIFLAAWLILLT
jgi:hypothetical protein